ncbi:MAG: hypothetical protein ACYTX0_37150 [Nostoc sp.]
MSAPLRVRLTNLEDLTLLELRSATTVPQRTRDRAHIIRVTYLHRLSTGRCRLLKDSSMRT